MWEFLVQRKVFWDRDPLPRHPNLTVMATGAPATAAPTSCLRKCWRALWKCTDSFWKCTDSFWKYQCIPMRAGRQNVSGFQPPNMNLVSTLDSSCSLLLLIYFWHDIDWHATMPLKADTVEERWWGTCRWSLSNFSRDAGCCLMTADRIRGWPRRSTSTLIVSGCMWERERAVWTGSFTYHSDILLSTPISFPTVKK